MGARTTRWHLFFSGQVQGVGFRYTTRQLANRLSLTGWVRNLSDRRVEATVEGPADVLTQFVEELAESTMGRVTDVEKIEQSATGEFQQFEITASM